MFVFITTTYMIRPSLLSLHLSHAEGGLGEVVWDLWTSASLRLCVSAFLPFCLSTSLLFRFSASPCPSPSWSSLEALMCVHVHLCELSLAQPMPFHLGCAMSPSQPCVRRPGGCWGG